MTATTKRARSKRRGKAKTLPTRFQPEFWEDLDQRLNLVKTIRENYETLLKETNATSLAKKILVQRVVFLAIRLEDMESKAASTGQFDQNAYTLAVNALSGLLSKLGLEAKEADVPELKDYLASKGGKS